MAYDDLTDGEKFVYKWQFRLHGDFKASLAHTIALADDINRERLKRAFPEEVTAMINFTDVSGWWQDVEKKKEGEK